MPNKNAKQTRLLSQGTFGCVYQPGLKCDGTIDSSSSYVTKLQKEGKTSDMEIAIGAKISTLPFFKHYFAPIEHSCPVKRTIISPNMVKECDPYQKHPDSVFTLNRIPFAGKDTIGDYIYHRYQFEKNFEPKFHEIYSHLLIGLQKLGELKIVHYDLKENNIMYNTKTNSPIIIDFGLSFDMTKFLSGQASMDDYFESFYVFYGNYSAWCIDVHICAFIIQNEDVRHWETSVIPVRNLKDMIIRYFDLNPIMSEMKKRYPQKVDSTRTKWLKFLKEQIGKNGKDVVDLIIKLYWKTWDNFSLAVIFWKLLKELNFSFDSSTIFRTMLEDIILSVPGDHFRDNPIQTFQKHDKLIK